MPGIVSIAGGPGSSSDHLLLAQSEEHPFPEREVGGSSPPEKANSGDDAVSRSRRKTPIAGITTAASNKAFKVFEHRRERAIVRTALAAGEEDVLHHKTTGNEWSSPRDGKRWHGNGYPKLMRK